MEDGTEKPVKVSHVGGKNITESSLADELAPKEDPWKEIKGKGAGGKVLTADLYKKSGLEKEGQRLLKEMRSEEEFRPQGFDAQMLKASQIDLNGDGQVDDRERAAILVAASLDKGKFDGNLSKQDRENFLSGKTRMR